MHTPLVDESPPVIEVDVQGLAGSFSPPRWLRDLGLLSWLIVGIGVVIVGLVWLLALTQAIFIPVVLGTVIAAVTTPLAGRLHRRGLGRAPSAALVLLGVLVVAALVLLAILGGIISESDQISALLTRSLDKVEGWLKDLGISRSQLKSELQKDVPDAGGALLGGIAGGLAGLVSVATTVVFAIFTTFFLLKDGPTMRRWVDRHMGLQEGVAHIVTGDTLAALRGYFLGVTIVAAFNAAVIGLGALILGIPLPGTIAVITFVGAYVPFIGAWVAGIFAVAMALTTGEQSDAILMAVIALLANGALQQVVQPIAYGATLGLNPLVVLVVTIGGGALFGMVGLVLAAPLTSAASNIAADLRKRREAAAPAVGPEPAAPG